MKMCVLVCVYVRVKQNVQRLSWKALLVEWRGHAGALVLCSPGILCHRSEATGQEVGPWLRGIDGNEAGQPPHMESSRARAASNRPAMLEMNSAVSFDIRSCDSLPLTSA
mmetsp:Transcript_36258/g.102475  ORF Transcript_36258/g.102475 Transcript_36258/m.102475 type:complete len:110 (+) Transcript_36258:3-332(+)